MEGETNSSNGPEKKDAVTPAEKTSPEDLVAQGRREAACGKHQEAAVLFEEACSELATKHDQMADEMAEPYFLYGKSLLEIARQEADFLGTAVPENEAESNEESDGEEQKVGESSNAGGAEAGGSGARQPPATTEATKETPEEAPKEGEPQEMDVGEPPAATEEEKEAGGPAAATEEKEEAGGSSNEPNATSKENEVENSAGDADEGQGEGEEDADEESEDVPTLQLAWEVLELSRIIYDKEADKNASRLAEVHLLLGEINMESDHQEEAVEEFRKALKIRESLLTPEDRRIAECHFQLGMALTFAKEFDKAVESYEFAKAVLKKKLESLTASGEDGEQVKSEAKEISELLPDLDSKIEDVVEMRKIATEQAADTKQDSSSGFDAPQLKGDAKPVQISVRRGRQSPSKDVIKMIRKRGSVGKIETNAAVDDGDESAAKRLKSEDADKPADTAANEQ